MIIPHVKQYGLNFCCTVIGIQKSSWYHYQTSTLRIQEQEKQEEVLKKQVIQIIADNPSYGYRRIQPELKKIGIVINHKKLLPLLRKWGVTIRRIIKYKTASGIDKILSFLGSRVMAIKRLSETECNQLGKIIFTDFTEILYNQGKAKIYLSTYLERVTKGIIGHALGDGPTTALTQEAFKKAVQRLLFWGVDITQSYFHQDQGSAYKSYEYVRMIVMKTKANISYSRVGTPGDNPEMESFFGRFKDEWRDVFLQTETKEEVIRLINMAMLYYNTKRIHSNHKNKSPFEFLQELQKAKKY